MITRMLFALAATCSIGLPSNTEPLRSGSGPLERLYLIDGSGGILVTYDPLTMERLSLQVSGNLNGMSSLTHGQGRLYTIERNVGIVVDQLVSYHPATAKASTVGPTGIAHSNAPSVKYDATRNEFFVLYQEFTTPAEKWYPDLYQIEPTTGAMTYVARITSGSLQPVFFPLSMAISPMGEAIVSEPSLGTGGPGLGRLDLHSGVVQSIGRVPLGIGNPRDISFDSVGRLWVLFDDWIDNTRDGIYVVDPETLSFEPKLMATEYPLSGMNAIAVVPLPPISTYCQPSSGTTCAPTLDWQGLPSATADSGFPVLVRGTPSTSTGMLLFGTGDPAPPFVGSILCFAPPYQATAAAPSTTAGTGSSCDGTWSADLNPLIYFSAQFAPGDTLRAQWIGLDPAAPPGERRVTSNALEFELAP